MLVDIQSKGSMKLFPHAMPCNQISNTTAYKNEGVVTIEGLQESSKGNSLWMEENNDMKMMLSNGIL